MIAATLLSLSAAAYVAPMGGVSRVAPQVRASSVAPMMGASKKSIEFEGQNDDGFLLEVREIDFGKPPVYLLSRIEQLGVATATAELGLLSKAEELGVFSTLEKLGAFSLIESTLPTIESLGILTLMQNSLDVEAGLIFSLANWLLVLAPIYILTASFAFLPWPTGVGVPVFLLFAGTTTATGVALFAWAFAVSKLQEDYE